jgi:hypothetical protein
MKASSIAALVLVISVPAWAGPNDPHSTSPTRTLGAATARRFAANGQNTTHTAWLSKLHQVAAAHPAAPHVGQPVALTSSAQHSLGARTAQRFGGVEAERSQPQHGHETHSETHASTHPDTRLEPGEIPGSDRSRDNEPIDNWMATFGEVMDELRAQFGPDLVQREHLTPEQARELAEDVSLETEQTEMPRRLFVRVNEPGRRLRLVTVDELLTAEARALNHRHESGNHLAHPPFPQWEE